jgi:hypothetical protein
LIKLKSLKRTFCIHILTHTHQPIDYNLNSEVIRAREYLMKPLNFISELIRISTCHDTNYQLYTNKYVQLK